MEARTTGNLTRDPELTFTNSGRAVCKITIADNYKPNKDAEDQVTFLDVTLWDQLAENFAASCVKGQRVFAAGRIKQEDWETDNGEKRSKLKMTADTAGPDLRWQTAIVSKSQPKAAKSDPNDDPF